MSFFFQKSQNDDNLQYDDTAFMHFAVAISIFGTIFFTVLIILDLLSPKNKIPPNIVNMPMFKDKIKNTLKKKKNNIFNLSFLVKIIILIVFASFGYFCYSRIKIDSKMIGFDPYQIMGIKIDASVSTIKKAYRKLALQHHPDRNKHNPQSNAKFIQISKAYKCLTDQKSKQNCLKYGNPDGQTSIKVGIGLPRFMIDTKNQYSILIPIFILLLFIIPFIFIKWSSKLTPTDKYGNLLSNYPLFFTLLSPKMNQGTFSILLGTMKQLQSLNPNKKTLQKSIEAQFKQHLLDTKTLTQQQLQKIPPHILYQCLHTYSYVGNVHKNQQLAYLLPQLLPKILMFTLLFTQKSNDKKLLNNNPQLKLTFYGYYPTLMAIHFSKKNYNPSLVQQTKSIEFLDLTPQQISIAKTIKIPNLHYHLLWNDNTIRSLLSQFKLQRSSYLLELIQSLPALKISAKLILADRQVHQITRNDFPYLQISITQKRKTPGYVLSKDYHYLTKQQFYLMITQDTNLILFFPIIFNPQSLLTTFKFPYHNTIQKDINLDICLLSANYPNMDLKTQLHFKIIPLKDTSNPIINKQDLNIEKIPKNFFETITSIDQWNVSDHQLSDGSDDEEQDHEKKNNQDQQQCCFKQQCGNQCEQHGDHQSGEKHHHEQENQFKQKSNKDNEKQEIHIKQEIKLVNQSKQKQSQKQENPPPENQQKQKTSKVDEKQEIPIKQQIKLVNQSKQKQSQKQENPLQQPSKKQSQPTLSETIKKPDQHHQDQQKQPTHQNTQNQPPPQQ